MSDISKIETISGLLLNIKDETARNLIQSEVTDRANADTTLQGNIDTNTEGIQNLTSGLSSTNKALKEETTNRQNAITSVTNSLNTEVKNRQDAVSTVTSSLNSEVTRAKGAESTLTTNLNAEITNRKNADTTLTTQVQLAQSTASEAGNEAKAVLNILNASMRLTKLWTNTAPSSDFASQTINLASTYTALLVTYRQWKGTTIIINAIILNNNLETTILASGSDVPHRTTKLNNNALFFNSGKTYSSGSEVNNDAVLVPTVIYGINNWKL